MKINRDILLRYFSGYCSEEEKSAIQRWLQSDEKHSETFIKERIAFDASLMINRTKTIQLRQNRVKRAVRSVFMIASFLLLLFACGYLLTLHLLNAKNKTILSVHAPIGSRTSVTLADGTKVWLNSNSTISYPNVFSKKERIVLLDGEGYFDVVKKNAPFIVKTAMYNIEVLGTTFNVEAYKQSNSFETTLLTGKVKLYKDEYENQSIYLNAGEAAKLANNSFVISLADARKLRWKEGLIVIEDNSFEEIMTVFEKYYGQRIIINNNSVKALGYRGKFRINDGVDHALRVLQKDFHFSYKYKEDANIIYIN